MGVGGTGTTLHPARECLTFSLAHFLRNTILLLLASDTKAFPRTDGSEQPSETLTWLLGSQRG